MLIVGADDHVAEVERARDRRRHDATARTARPCTGPVRYTRPGLPQRLRARARGDLVVPICAAHAAFVPWMPAVRGTAARPSEHPSRPGGIVTDKPAKSCSPSWRENVSVNGLNAPAIGVTVPAAERRGEPVCHTGDRERGRGRRVRARFGGAPRFQHARRRRRAAALRVRERRALPAGERQLHVFEGQLRVFIEARAQLAGRQAGTTLCAP